ncbi:hypothetical protein ABZP36_026852 [Zizania latifolia]
MIMANINIYTVICHRLWVVLLSVNSYYSSKFASNTLQSCITSVRLAQLSSVQLINHLHASPTSSYSELIQKQLSSTLQGRLVGSGIDSSFSLRVATLSLGLLLLIQGYVHDLFHQQPGLLHNHHQLDHP